MTHLTDLELRALKQFAADNPKRFVLTEGCSGLVTCDGYALEMYDGKGHFLGVMHPKQAIDMLLEVSDVNNSN